MAPRMRAKARLALLMLLLLSIALELVGSHLQAGRVLRPRTQSNRDACILFPFPFFRQARIKERHHKILKEYFHLLDVEKDSVKWANMFSPNATLRIADSPALQGRAAIAKLAQAGYDLNVTCKHDLVKVYSVSEDVIIFEGVANNNVSGRVLPPDNCAGVFELAPRSNLIAHYRAYLVPIDFTQYVPKKGSKAH